MENKKLPGWREADEKEKAMILAQTIGGILIVIFGLLKIFGIWEYAIEAVQFVLAVEMLILSVRYRAYHHTMSILCLGMGVYFTMRCVAMFSKMGMLSF